MKATEAVSLGGQIREMVASGAMREAQASLSPLLGQRIPFRTLDRIGDEIGAGPISPTRTLLHALAGMNTLGGWPIIGSALARQLDRDLRGAVRACREFILLGGKWYTTDILSERVLGRALATSFADTLDLLETWRQDSDRWVRRALGVAAHRWTVRTRGAETSGSDATALLSFLAPLFAERETDAVKGIGWGLKTIGRYYPERLAPWLHEMINVERRACRKLMLRKAITYLPEDQRAMMLNAWDSS